jgi:hypothetical protein
MKILIIGRHRNAALAERHRREIERDNPNSTVRIISRTNDAGQLSERGRNFDFEINTEEVEKEVNNLEDFWDEFDDAVEYELDEYGSRPEYGEE